MHIYLAPILPESWICLWVYGKQCANSVLTAFTLVSNELCMKVHQWVLAGVSVYIVHV